MKRILVLILCHFNLICYSQGITTSGYWGFAIGETAAFKKIMLVTGWDVGLELHIARDLGFCIEPGITRIFYDYSNASGLPVFETRKTINLPLSVKKYIPISKTAWGFVKFGVFGSYGFYDKKEIKDIQSQDQKTSDLGYNAGILGGVGLKKKIHRLWTFDIGIAGQQDYFTHYKNEADKLKTARTMLSVSFFRILGE